MFLVDLGLVGVAQCGPTLPLSRPPAAAADTNGRNNGNDGNNSNDDDYDFELTLEGDDEAKRIIP